MSTSLFQIANSNYFGSGSIGFGTVVSKFGRVAGRSGVTIEPENESISRAYETMSLYNPIIALIPGAISASSIFTLYSTRGERVNIAQTAGTQSRIDKAGNIVIERATNLPRITFPSGSGGNKNAAFLIEPIRTNLIGNNNFISWTPGASASYSTGSLLGITCANISVNSDLSTNGISSPGSGAYRVSHAPTAYSRLFYSASVYAVSWLYQPLNTNAQNTSSACFINLISGSYSENMTVTANLGTGGVTGTSTDSKILFVTGSVELFPLGNTNRTYRIAAAFTTSRNDTIGNQLTCSVFAFGFPSTIYSSPTTASGAFVAPQIELISAPGAIGSATIFQPTSYIPALDTAATSTRNASVITITTASDSGVFSASLADLSNEGTVYIEFLPSPIISVSSSPNERYLTSFYQGNGGGSPNNARMEFNLSNLTPRITFNYNSNSTSSAGTRAGVDNRVNKVAYTWKTNSTRSAYINGVLSATSSQNHPYTSWEAIRIGAYISSNSDVCNMPIYAIAFYDRALTNDQLANLTSTSSISI